MSGNANEVFASNGRRHTAYSSSNESTDRVEVEQEQGRGSSISRAAEGTARSKARYSRISEQEMSYDAGSDMSSHRSYTSSRSRLPSATTIVRESSDGASHTLRGTRSRLSTLQGEMMGQTAGSDGDRTPRKSLVEPEAGGTLGRSSRPSDRLRHQASTATIRSRDARSGDVISAATTSADSVQRTSAVERRKRSEMLERDVSRMRSESRLSVRQDEMDTKEQGRDRPASRIDGRTSSLHHRGVDTTDTSGTEGSGPVIGDRRRKKSSYGTGNRRAVAEMQTAQYQHPGDNTNDSTLDAWGGTEGDDSRSSSYDQPSVRRKPSRYYSPVGERAKPRPSNSPDGGRVWPRTSQGREDAAYAGEAANRARRGFSDPDAEALPTTAGAWTQREGHGGSAQNGRSPYRRITSSLGRAGEVDEALQSSHEVSRLRKVSTPSTTFSHRSSGAASDLHRSVSRNSLRRAFGRDVFDDAPPLPYPSGHPDSPRARAMEQRTERIRQLRERQKLMNETAEGREGRSSGVDELRARIDALTGVGGDGRASYSRASSRASRSNVSSTPSTSIATPSAGGSIRPATEPRKASALRDHGSAEVSPEQRRLASSLRQEQNPSRLGGAYGTLGAVNSPHTPDPSHPTLRRITSRLGDSQSRLGLGRPSTAMANASTPAHNQDADHGALHVRNLRSCIDDLERSLLGPDYANPATRDAMPHAVRMLVRLRDTCEASIEINAGLRTMVQAVLAFQIDAELELGSGGSTAAFERIDQGLSTVLRWSDEQMRNLTEGILAMVSLPQLTPASHLRSSVLEQDRRDQSLSQSRLGMRTVTSPTSPKKTDASLGDRILRRTSMYASRGSVTLSRLGNYPDTGTRRAAIPSFEAPSAGSPEVHRRSQLDNGESLQVPISRQSSSSGSHGLSERSLRRLTVADPTVSPEMASDTSPLQQRMSPLQARTALTERRRSTSRSRGATALTQAVEQAWEQEQKVNRRASTIYLSKRTEGFTYGGHHRSASSGLAASRSTSSTSIKDLARGGSAMAPPPPPSAFSPGKTRPSVGVVSTVNATTHQALNDAMNDSFDAEMRSASAISIVEAQSSPAEVGADGLLGHPSVEEQGRRSGSAMSSSCPSSYRPPRSPATLPASATSEISAGDGEEADRSVHDTSIDTIDRFLAYNQSIA